MGFYIDLKPLSAGEFKETEVPFAFWALFAIAGFALLCMGLASHMLLADLVKAGNAFDFTLVALIFLSVPFYFLIGLKLVFVKKFVSIQSRTVRMGYKFGKKTFWQRLIPLSEVESVDLVNKRPTKNVAPVFHNDQQYHIQGHWRVLLNLKSKKTVVLDKHTDVDALKPLYDLLCQLKQC